MEGDLIISKEGVCSTPQYTFSVHEFDCPKCGVVKNYISVTLGDKYLDGKYCQACWARWMKEHVPMLTERKKA